jgi:hypothetical protein
MNLLGLPARPGAIQRGRLSHPCASRVKLALESAGVTKPARMYDLRSTFASNALAAGITVNELARSMGTSVSMIEAHYGAASRHGSHRLLDRLESLWHLSGTSRQRRTPDLAQTLERTMGLEPREALPTYTTLDDERLRSPTAMRVCGTRQSVDPHGYVARFSDAWARSGPEESRARLLESAR